MFKDEGEGDDDLDGFNAITEELQAALLEDKSLLILETENLSIKDELSAFGGGIPSHYLMSLPSSTMPPPGGKF